MGEELLVGLDHAPTNQLALVQQLRVIEIGEDPGAQSVVIKLFGLGLASAVLVDAFLIRLVLVPALMFMFGLGSWWMPAPIERRLPRLSIEGPAEPAPDSA